jgi:hypothetical protein
MKVSIQEAKEQIESLDLSMICKKLTRLGWRPDEVELGIRQYKNLLFLWKKYPDQGPLPPSEDIDEVWHNHILDTEKYHQDCNAIFGRYLHHYPYFGIDDKSTQEDLNAAFEITKSLYLKEFGEELTRVRLSFRLIAKALFRSLLKSNKRI